MPKTSSEDRDLAAIKERRAASQPGIPSPEIADDVTSPVDLITLEREKYDHDDGFRAEMDALRERYEADPAFRAMWNMTRRSRRDSNQTMKTLANAALAAQPTAEMIEQVRHLGEWKREIETMLGITKWILGFVVAATLGSVAVVAGRIYTWGQNNGEVESRLQHLERDLDTIQKQILFSGARNLFKGANQ